MHFALRELRNRLVHPLRLIVWLAVSVICILSGPFGTDTALEFPLRSLFWLSITGLAIVFANVILIATDMLNPRRPAYVVAIGQAVVFGLGFGVLLKGATALTISLDHHVTPIYWYLVVTAALPFLAVVVIKQIANRTLADEDGGPALLARLPADLRADLVRVSSQDHYVEVVTRAGRELILMRFADALVELDGATGLQVHRSHWVHPSAVVAAERSPGKLFLVLDNGDRIPVSRTHRDAVERAGLL